MVCPDFAVALFQKPRAYFQRASVFIGAVLPKTVDPCTYGVCRLAIRQVLQELQHRHDHQQGYRKVRRLSR